MSWPRPRGEHKDLLTLFWLCKCELDTSPVRRNKICQEVPVFPVVINNRRTSYPYSCLREGYISRVPDQNGVSQAWYVAELHHSGQKPSKFSFWSWIIVPTCTENSNKRSHGVYLIFSSSSSQKWVNDKQTNEPPHCHHNSQSFHICIAGRPASWTISQILKIVTHFH